MNPGALRNAFGRLIAGMVRGHRTPATNEPHLSVSIRVHPWLPLAELFGSDPERRFNCGGAAPRLLAAIILRASVTPWFTARNIQWRRPGRRVRLLFFHTTIRAEGAGDARGVMISLGPAMPSTTLSHPAAPFALLDWKSNLIRAGLPAETAWRYSTEIRRFLRRCEMLQLPVDRRCVAPYLRSIPPRSARVAAAAALRWFFDAGRNPAQAPAGADLGSSRSHLLP